MRQHKQQIRRILALSLTLLVLFSSGVGFAADKKDAAKTDTKKTDTAKTDDISDAVAQSYNADPSVQVGMLVKLKEKDPTTVTPATEKDGDALLGVVVPKDGATIVLSPDKVSTGQVLVATVGSFSVLVSNQGGPIKVGDYLAVSAISGVAMKADENQKKVIGKATAAFTGTANVIGNVKLKNSTGGTSSVSIGRVELNLKISSNPIFQKAANFVPGFAAKAAVSIADKPVSVARIYLGMTILAVTAFITASLLYSGIRNGMIAVGRNPLSKKSIIGSLIQTVMAGLIIFVAGIIAVYLLLKL